MMERDKVDEHLETFLFIANDSLPYVVTFIHGIVAHNNSWLC